MNQLDLLHIKKVILIPKFLSIENNMIKNIG